MPPKSGMVCGRHWPTPVADKTRESQQGEKGDYMKKSNKLHSLLRNLTKLPTLIQPCKLPHAQGEMRQHAFLKKWNTALQSSICRLGFLYVLRTSSC